MYLADPGQIHLQLMQDVLKSKGFKRVSRVGDEVLYRHKEIESLQVMLDSRSYIIADHDVSLGAELRRLGREKPLVVKESQYIDQMVALCREKIELMERELEYV